MAGDVVELVDHSIVIVENLRILYVERPGSALALKVDLLDFWDPFERTVVKPLGTVFSPFLGGEFQRRRPVRLGLCSVEAEEQECETNEELHHHCGLKIVKDTIRPMSVARVSETVESLGRVLRISSLRSKSRLLRGILYLN